MDFEDAVALLSQAHRDEVHRLRQAIANLESRVVADASMENKRVSKGFLVEEHPDEIANKSTVILTSTWTHPGDTDYNIEYSFKEVTSEQDVVSDKDVVLSIPNADADVSWPGDPEGPQGAVGRWRTLTEHIIGAGHPTELNCLLERGARRWLLLSHRYISHREERAISHAIRPAVVKFELMPVWTRRKPSISSAAGRFKLTSVDSHMGDLLLGTGLLRNCTIHPHSVFAFVWALLVGIVVMYDVFAIPLDLCSLFTPPTFLLLLYSMFWLFDLIVSCSTGIEREDYVIDMRVSTIVHAYARSWLIPDLLLLFIDLLFLGLDLLATIEADGDGFFRTLRANRMIRLVRLVRLFRMRKLGTAWHAFFSSSSVAYLVMVGKLFQHAVVICIVNHYIACMWYGLGAWKADVDEPTWLNMFEHLTHSRAAWYAYSLHWALAQVSPATQNISPQNPYERTFALCIALFSLMSFSWFVSQVTTALNQLLKARQGREREEMLLRDFCRRRGVSTKIVSRIMEFFKRNYDNIMTHSTEGNIEFLSELPESMRLHLHMEMYLPILTTHIFFDFYYSHATRGTLLKLCHTAMSEMWINPCQDVFIPRTVATHVYILKQGKMLYALGKKEIGVPEDGTISEVSFWVKWEHVGTLTASIKNTCELVSIDLGIFHSIFAYENGAVHETFRLLAIFAVEQMEIAASRNSNFTDLPLPDSIREEIVRKTDHFNALKKNMERDGLRRSISSSGEELTAKLSPDTSAFGWSVTAAAGPCKTETNGSL